MYIFVRQPKYRFNVPRTVVFFLFSMLLLSTFFATVHPPLLWDQNSMSSEKNGVSPFTIYPQHPDSSGTNENDRTQQPSPPTSTSSPSSHHTGNEASPWDYKTPTGENYYQQSPLNAPFESQNTIPLDELPPSLTTWDRFLSHLEKTMSKDALFDSLRFNVLEQQYDSNALVKIHEDNKIEYSIRIKGQVAQQQLQLFLEKFNGEIIKYYDEIGVYVVKIPVSMKAFSAFLSEAENTAFIKFVEPNFYYKAFFVPDDPKWSSQWGPQLIGIEQAWNTTFGSRNIKVAVIDTGIDYTHPDLQANYLSLGYDWINDDTDPMDDNGHGTHVAGTIAAGINNTLGVAGLANVSIFAEKFLSSLGYGSNADAAAAINHAVSMGADILSNSWGGSGYSSLLQEAIDNATASGVLVIAAMGNDGGNIKSYPAAFPNVVAVGATDNLDQVASFSNYGDWIDVAAPGVNILSTVPNNGYDSYSGTSMATPHVSGLTALLWSQFPNYTAEQITTLLEASAVDLGAPGFDPYYGWGRIDAASAIFGLQDHNLRVNVVTPPFLPLNEPIKVYGRVTNSGAQNETNVNLSLYVNGTLVNSTTIPTLVTGTNYEISYNLRSSMLDVYNITVAATPVTGENVTVDNFYEKLVPVKERLLPTQRGDTFAYLYPIDARDPLTPFSFKWVISDVLSPLEYVISLITFDPVTRQETLFSNYTLNPYTREIFGVSYWQLFPYWINTTGISNGTKIDLFAKNAQDATVIGETVFDYYGESLPAWIILDTANELLYFDKETGILLDVAYYSNQNSTFFTSTFINVLPAVVDLHNIKIAVPEQIANIVNSSLSPVTIDVLALNTGEYQENIQVSLFINNSLLSTQTVSLSNSSYAFLNWSWTPSGQDVFEIKAVAAAVTGETFLVDNNATLFTSTFPPQNYNLYFAPFSWYNASANGALLSLQGIDVATAVTLPFVFQYYGQVFTKVYVSSNGWLSFTNVNPVDYYNPPFPTTSPSYTFAVAPFWDDLKATANNIYTWLTPDFTVIEFVNMTFYSGKPAGTFEVVFFSNGTILFQYLEIFEDRGATVGLNYGLDSNYYTTYPYGSLDDVQNLSIFFTTETLQLHDIHVTLEIPSPIIANRSNTLTANVFNTGTFTETNINFIMYLNNTVVQTTTISQLAPGENTTISYTWAPTLLDTFTVTAYVTPVNNEAAIQNNKAVRLIKTNDIHIVGGYIMVYVRDALNYSLLSQATVTTYDENNIVIDVGTTDTSGFYNVTGLDIGTYTVEVSAPGYHDGKRKATIYYLGDIAFLYFYLYIPGQGPTISVVDPINGTTIDGGSILVNFNVTDHTELSYIDVFVNNKFTTVIKFFPNISDTRAYVPVFQNGTNLLTFTAYWFNGYFSNASVIIQSVNVVPIAHPKIGDYLHWRYNTTAVNSLYSDFNFTFIESLSPTEFNVSLTVHRFDSNGTTKELTEYWLTVNILNGYIANSNMWWEHKRFYFFSGLSTPLVPQLTVTLGDTAPMWEWDDIVTVNEMDSWNGYDTWSLNSSHLQAHALQSNGLIVYENVNFAPFGFFFASYTAYITNSSFLPSNDTTPPTLSTPIDITYEEGTTGHTITWTATDDNPDYYVITKNGTVIAEGQWNSMTNITISIDGLTSGIYLYQITINDTSDNRATDSVLVTVVDTTAPIFIKKPADITYEEGTTGNQLEWIATDLNPDTYIIYRNDTSLTSGKWTSSESITISVDRLVSGVYNYTIVVTDKYGNSNAHTVIVTVTTTTTQPPTSSIPSSSSPSPPISSEPKPTSSTTPQRRPTPGFLFVPLILSILSVVILKKGRIRRKRT